MTQLHAQPYDLAATGFFFDSADDYASKAAKNINDYGQPVEEYEIQFIDGDDLDCELANAWSLSQVNMVAYYKAVDEWSDEQKLIFIIAVGECGYSFDHTTVDPDDFDVDVYEVDSLKELAEQFIDDGLYGAIPDPLQYYIDTDAIARDLAVDYTEANISGKRLVYACR